MQEPAFAKLNLALHVRRREPDGYHQLETLFAFVEAGDLLSVADGDSLSLRIIGPFSGGLETADDNLVMKATAALRDRFKVDRGAELTLEKNLPLASGIGGGSADAAATLRLLTRFWSLPTSSEDLFDIARNLGSDVPACLLSQPMRGEGRGERLTPMADWALGGTPVLLVNPRKALSTADVFAAWDGQDRGSLGDPLAGRNDLELPALRLLPEIGEVLGALRTVGGAFLVRMSGSGATCFALYEDDPARDAAHAQIARSHPHWWLLASRLRD